MDGGSPDHLPLSLTAASGKMGYATSPLSKAHLNEGSEQYSDFCNLSMPIRWHPDYTQGGNSSSTLLPDYSSQPHSASNGNHVTSFLSPIPEDSPSLRRMNRGIDNNNGDLPYHGFSDMDVKNNPFWDRRYSETDMLRVPKFAKRGRKDSSPTRRSLRVSAKVLHSQTVDDSLSQSSEGYGSIPNLESRPSVSLPGNKIQRSGSLDSITDSESMEWRRDPARNIDRRRHSDVPLPRRLQSVQITLESPSSPSDLQSESSQNDLRRQSSGMQRRLSKRASSKSFSQSDFQRRPSVKTQKQLQRSHRRLSLSSNSLRPHGNSSGTSGMESPASSRRSETFKMSRSEPARSSVASSRHQSIFSMGSRPISAEMVSSNPSAAAHIAFSSVDFPRDLMPTKTRHLRHICRPMMTCLLLVILAASLGAAVYFAVVLNKTQAEHIEYLRARLNFHLNQTSEDSLASMSASERTKFEEQYCKEISDYYRDSELSKTYRGCEVASIRDGKLIVLLYFDKPTGNGLPQSNKTEDVILHVLASSAPRIGQQQSDVISVNNVPVKLSSVDISVEQTSETPKFSTDDFSSGISGHILPITGTEVQTAGTTMTSEPQPTPSSPDPFHPCAPGESHTYYRYPGTCSIFFQCLDGRPITLSCGGDLVFDLDRMVCARSVTGCDEAREEADFFTEADPEDLQPCEYKGGTFHPHPRVCNLYFQCSMIGTSIKGVCPDGLVFSAQYQTCVLLDQNFTCSQAMTNQNGGISNSNLERDQAKKLEPFSKNVNASLENVEQAD